MAAKKSLILKQVKDITNCPICEQTLCNPKMLPCFHTFCLECIELFCECDEEGNNMPCPMCRREFRVPAGGLSRLNPNFFIERLIAVQAVSMVKEVVDCDVCLTGKQCQVEASFFCLECQENMCDSCSDIHKSMKMTMSHHLSTNRDVSAMEALKNEVRRAICDKHSTEEIKFYCRDCKIPFCATCFIAKHNKHECCEIEEIVEEFKKGFKCHSVEVNELLINIKIQSDEVDKQLAEFTLFIDTTENDILERSGAIKQMVEKHTQALLKKLKSHETHVLKNIQYTKEEFQKNMTKCENFVSYCQKAIEEADAVESIRMAEELRTRAEELKVMPIPELNKLPDIQFHQSDLDVATNLGNIVGNIHGRHSFVHKLVVLLFGTHSSIYS